MSDVKFLVGAPLKTAKEPGEKHRLEPYFNFGGRKFFNHMNQKNIFIGIIVILVIGVAGYFVFVRNQISPFPTNNILPINSNQLIAPSPSAEEKLLEIELEVNAPFSTAKLTIFEDATALYSEKQRGQEEQQGIYEEVNIEARDRQMKNFLGLVRKNNFFSMKDKSYKESDPLDGSSYTLTIKIRPSGPPE